MKQIYLVVLLMFGLASGTYAQTLPPTEKAISQVNGVLWTQQSLEHHAAAAMAYHTASAALPRVIHGKLWASLEQGKAKLQRPAVILDVDETVLDNSEYDAWAVQNNQAFAPQSWSAWIRREAAPAVPGAVRFTQLAAKLGVDVFYVSNRECVADEADPCPALTHTQSNMARLGFARANDRAAFMFKKQRPEWSVSDKSERRAKIAETHRVIMLIGDDMGDFLPVASVERLRRGEADAAASEIMSHFGMNLFMIPNPSYGSWEKALPANPAARIPLLKGLEGL
ncbi:5'-nucleotidase, lipoprotein e(P4) family [Uliginosibacterium sp. TH139]|uniref:5'-nucleotidase, lipoprotein e(P4) family n=1 Tax=Uliginosibacterium sp. TH139 TaxID=2067453 RepID=UPI00118156C8|nr:HAD family acid phosphatase [Uliginosibacterium sp. TH139]